MFGIKRELLTERIVAAAATAADDGASFEINAEREARIVIRIRPMIAIAIAPRSPEGLHLRTLIRQGRITVRRIRCTTISRRCCSKCRVGCIITIQPIVINLD